MPNILFVCTGNQFRSPIAAAYLQRLLTDCGCTGWKANSAGTWTEPGRSPGKELRRVANALQLDIADHRTRLVDKPLLDASDLVLVMETGHKEALRTEFPEARDRIYLLSEMLDGAVFEIQDPVLCPGEQEDVLRDMCKVIDQGFLRIMVLVLNTVRGRA